GTTGAALPAPGKTGAIFLSPGTPGIGLAPKLAFDPTGHLNVVSNLDSVLNFDTVSGALLGSAFVGKSISAPTDIIFDAQGKLYESADGIQVLVATQGEPMTLTDINGAYVFNGLATGTYTAAELLPANSSQTFDINQASAVIT